MKRCKLDRTRSCSRRTAETSTTLDTLARNGVLAIVNAMLDDESLLTVLSHFEPFRHEVRFHTVERTMGQVFGARWKSYYDAFSAHVCNFPDRLWGLGYDLKAPSQSHLTNAYIVETVLETLESMAHNCTDYDVSFIPGEPTNAGIDRIWFAENGRLIWVQYHSWENRYHGCDYLGTIQRDYLNYTGTYPQCSGIEPNLDGQLIIGDDHYAQTMILQSHNQETNPPAVPDFGHEIWDLAARPEPRCLWSHFWRAHDLTDDTIGFAEIPTSFAYPVERFASQWIYHAMLPNMKPFTLENIVYDKNRPIPRENYKENCLRPIRFLKFSVSGLVIDVLPVEKLKFRGITKLVQPTLSADGRHLGALVQMGSTFTLAVWKTGLPRAALLWKDGLEGLCSNCHWFMDKSWLIVHCAKHGTFAYFLESQAPDAIDITRFVKSIGRNAPLTFYVCGLYDNLLICDGPDSPGFSIIKFTFEGAWRAKCIYLRPLNQNLTHSESSQLHLETRNFICNVGQRFLLSNTGDVFDLGPVSRPQCGDDTVQHLSLGGRHKVIAIHDLRNCEKTIVVGCQHGQHNPVLKFWLLTPESWRKLNCPYPKRVHLNAVRVLKFSPDGRVLHLTPSRKGCYGWIFVFTAASVREVNCNDKYDVRVLNLSKQWCIGRKLQLATFLAGDALAVEDRSGEIHGRKLSSDSEHSSFSVLLVDELSPQATILRDNLLYPRYSKEEISILRRPCRRVRCIDILQSEPRSLEYCRSIHRTGTYAALSPDGRFLAYAAHRVPQVNAAPHIELRDLTQQNQNPDDIRGSERSLLYALQLRRDYRRPYLPLALDYFF